MSIEIKNIRKSFDDFAALPISAISPMDSWPTEVGVFMFFCAHSSHLKMWTSVPQIAALRTLINTSVGPISGIGTSSIQMPDSAFAFTSDFISDHSQLATHLLERRNGVVEVALVLCCRHLRPDPRLALRHHRVAEPDHVDAVAQ